MSWTWLSEDPWPLAGTLALIAVLLLIRVKYSQQGKHLAWAVVALGLAGVVVLVEQLWVTDRERIETAVYDMADAVKESDFERLESYLAPEFEEGVGMITRALLRGRLMSMEFEVVRIAQLEIQAGRVTRMGKADFLGQAQWTRTSEGFGSDFGGVVAPPGIGFSFGFREVEPNEWKVTRIEVTRVPYGTPASVTSFLSRGGSSR